jgi:hypothetical protein
MRHTANAVILATLITAGAAAQTSSPVQPADVDRLGPQVGETVPDFSAADQFGRTQTLKSIVGPNGAMLFFNRSADW